MYRHNSNSNCDVITKRAVDNSAVETKQTANQSRKRGKLREGEGREGITP